MLVGLAIYLFIYAAMYGSSSLSSSAPYSAVLAAVLSAATAIGLIAKKKWGSWLWFALAIWVVGTWVISIPSQWAAWKDLPAAEALVNAYPTLLFAFVFVAGSIVVFCHFYVAPRQPSFAARLALATLRGGFVALLASGVAFFLVTYSHAFINISFISFGASLLLGVIGLLSYLCSMAFKSRAHHS